MKWLIKVDQNADLAAVWAQLRSAGCMGDESLSPIPLDGGEQTIEVEGPENLPERLKGVPHVLGIYPNSDLTLY